MPTPTRLVNPGHICITSLKQSSHFSTQKPPKCRTIPTHPCTSRYTSRETSQTHAQHLGCILRLIICKCIQRSFHHGMDYIPKWHANRMESCHTENVCTVYHGSRNHRHASVCTSAQHSTAAAAAPVHTGSFTSNFIESKEFYFLLILCWSFTSLFKKVKSKEILLLHFFW